jgi:MFS transporter, DHA1 family, multidrug resistance protein
VDSRGLAMGGYNTAIYLGMMLGAAGMGPVNQRFGFETGFFLAAAINLIFTLMFFLLFKSKKFASPS